MTLRRVASKYGAKKTQVDGIVFASKREATRYLELKALEASGHISGLKLQPSFEIIPAVILDGKKQRATKYIGDFEYINHLGERVIEDSKGFKNDVYRLKRKLLKHVHGIEVVEV